MKDPANHRRAYELFQAIYELDAAQRAEALEREPDRQLAREVQELLVADEGAEVLERPAPEHLTGLDAATPSGPALPRSIGEFEVLSLLGEGGMGVVYEARQPTRERTVALKLIRPGLVSDARLRRFENEARVLDLLDHPCIARVHGAGTAETSWGAQPYIAMEFVRGTPLNAYSRDRGLAIEEQLELLAQVCGAIQHAHQRGVIHRDLKPANILVTNEGSIKVLDFGVARITDADRALVGQATATGEVLGTLPYMSPEQLGADSAEVDQRSDVYAVGVIAYQLLSGELPIDVRNRSLAEAARMVEEKDPTTLGQLDDRLRGSVEWIVAKALAKDKKDRYASARELGQDLERHLARQPVEAAPPGRLELWRRFSRRNRGLVAGLSVALLAVVIGAAVTTVLLLRTSTLLEERNEEVAAAEEAIGFLEGLFDSADPLEKGNLRLSEFVARAGGRFEGALEERPLQRARLLNSIGKAMLDLRMAAPARPLLDEAREICAAEYGEDSLEHALVLERLGRLEQIEFRFEEALRLQEEVVRIRRALLGPSKELADALNNLQGSLSSLGRTDEGLAAQDEAVAIMRELFGPRDERTLQIEIGRATNLEFAGHYVEAEEVCRRILERESEIGRALQVQARLRLAQALRHQERRAEALDVVAGAIERTVSYYGVNAAARQPLDELHAMLLSEVGRPRAALEVLEGMRARVLAVEGPGSAMEAELIHNMAFVTHSLPPPENAEAEALYEAAAEAYEAAMGPAAPRVWTAKHNLAQLLLDLDRPEDALPVARAAYEGRLELLGETNPNTLISLRGLAQAHYLLWQYEEEASLYRTYLRSVVPAMGDANLGVQIVRLRLVESLAGLGRLDEARAIWAEAQAHRDRMASSERMDGRFERARKSLERGRIPRAR